MALSSKGQETRLSTGKWPVRFSQASPIWRDGQGQVAGFSVQRRMVVPCSRHQYGSLDQRSRSPPSQGGNARSNRARITIWLLGQGKVARFSGGRRWLVCHQQSPSNLQLGSLAWEIPRIFTEHLNTNGEVAPRWVYFAGGTTIPASVLWPRRRIGQSHHPFKVERACSNHVGVTIDKS